VADRYRHRGLPERWLLPPPPREAEAAKRWEALPFDERRRLARVDAATLGEQDPDDRQLVGALARARLATSWRLLAAAPVLGWLVLMTVWGFGRSTAPAAAGTYLLWGIGLGAITWFVVALAAARRLRRARKVASAAEPPPDPAA
jgi:hypothetical protein